MSANMHRLRWACVGSILTFLIGSSATAAGSPSRINLTGEWWQLAASIPVPENPINDDTGVRCITGQRADVWFLFGTFGNTPGEPTVRYCTVPANVPLFFPIVNLVCVPFPGETISLNRQICKESIDAVDSMSLHVDDVDRSNRIKRRKQSVPFPVSIPEENIFDFPGFDAPAGLYLGVADGYYAKLRLAKGEHTVHIQGGISSNDFAIDVIYVLQVTDPQSSITPRP